MGFLEDILDMTEEAESPRKFWYLAGLCAISAVSKHLYLERYYYKLYPNIYILLTGPSGVRKGPPIKLAKQIVELTDYTRVISGSNTIQSVLTEVAKAKSLKSGGILTDSSCFLVSDEASNLLQDDPRVQTLLTQLYDAGYHDTWRSSTKYGGVDELKNPYFTILMASAPVHLAEFIQERSVTGGFIGRTLVFNESQRHTLNSLVDAPSSTPNVQKLADYLKQIIKLKGVFKFSDGGKKRFDEWYMEFNQELEASTDRDDTGTADRLPDHVLKFSMLHSLSRRLDLLLTEEDINDSIKFCTIHTSSIKQFEITGKVKGEISPKVAVVITELLKAPDFTMDRSKLLQRTYMKDVDAFSLNRVQDSMEEAGMIEVIREIGKPLKLKLKPHIAEYFQAKMNKKREETKKK